MGLPGLDLIKGAADSFMPGDKSGDYYKQALANYAGIELPDIEKMKLALQQYQDVGSLDPRLEQLVNLGPSAMEQVSTDPRLRQQQMAALESIAGLASGVPTQADLAGFELARQNSAAEAQAKQNQILQEMQQRGQGGSGAELLARLHGNQASTQNLQQAELEQAKAMQQARLAALQQQASMSGNLRSQDYGEAANLARAKDTINQFNAQNAQSVGARNVGAQNQAQAANLQNRQQTANLNTQTMNQQQQANKNLQQQQFQNQMALAGGKSGVIGQQAADATKRQANEGALMGGLLQAGMTAAAASDKNLKKDITKSDDIQKFLDNLTAYNYNYKDTKFGDEPQTGVMAQDLEKTPQGKAMVENTSEGKMVDYGKGLGTMMAALAHLNNRLNNIEGK